MTRIPPRNGVDQIWDAIRRLQQTSTSSRGTAGAIEYGVIGKGGLTVKNGGSVDVQDGGDISLGPGSRLVIIGDDTYVQIADDEFSIGTIAPDGGGFTGPSMAMNPTGMIAAMTSDQYAFFGVSEVDGAAIVASSVNLVRLPYQLTGDSANVRVLYDGTIQMVTSSLRYKQDVEDAEVDPAAVLQMRRRTWRQKSDVEADPDTTTRYVGFIAEELHDLGLHQFVEYDDEGRPNAIRYDRLSVALHAVAEDQQAQIDALSARLDALEAK